MTEIPGPGLTPELRAWFETWKTCVEQVLSRVSGHAMAFEISADPLAAGDSDVWYLVTSGGAAPGEMTLRFPADSAVRLAQRCLGDTEPTGGPSTEHKEALEELLRQIAGQAATVLAVSVGGEVQFQLSAAAAPAWPAAGTVCLRTRDEAGTPVVIEVRVSAELASAMQAATEVKAGTSAPAEPAELPPEAASYQRLMDVELEVKLRFGSRRMVLRDVLALGAGVVVELESNVNAPVDLLLDGRTIAQGEVVVVDGRYGLRVTQVLDRRPPA